jgi:hypothetical protein
MNCFLTKAGNIHESARVLQLILSLTAKVEYNIDFLKDQGSHNF